MTAAGLHKHRSIRPTVCAKCGLEIKFEESYVHAKRNYHWQCYVDSKGRPIFHPRTAKRQALPGGGS